MITSERKLLTRYAGAGLAMLQLCAVVWAQAQAPDTPVVFRVDVVSRTTKAINFHHRQGATTVGLEGSSLAPKAKGTVRVDSKTGATKIDANVDKMPPASSIAEGYLTYVLWAITPEGRAENLGEVMLNDDHARLQAATELQTFGMIITAEPYYAVTQPSDMVVMEGVVRSGGTSPTTGTIMPIEAKYELVARGGYLQNLPPADRVKLREAKNIPLDLMEARQAMAVARSAGGSVYAADTLKKADVDLYNAEAMLKSGQDREKIQTLARHVTQLAEDARLISVKKANEEALAAERAASERRTTELTQTAENETQRRRQAELEAQQREREADEARRRSEQIRQQSADTIASKDKQLAEETERAKAAAALAQETAAREQALAAENARLRASAATDKEETAARLRQLEMEAAQARKDAELAAKQRDETATRQRELESESTRIRQEAEAARQAAERAEADRAKVRAELMRQLNVVLATRETARGLIVNMSDVLFDIGRHSLKPGAREKLAKIAGILQSQPGIKVEVEGHTDSTGGAALNQRLSEQRADTVKQYLTSQGIDSANITARGFGPDKPVADNASATGRQANRRVELVVSGPMMTQGSGL